MENKYRIGDEVRIINYGHKIFVSKRSEPEYTLYKNHKNLIGENEDLLFIDIRPELVGRTGIISKVSSDDNSYAIADIGAWYNSNQLELV